MDEPADIDLECNEVLGEWNPTTKMFSGIVDDDGKVWHTLPADAPMSTTDYVDVEPHE